MNAETEIMRAIRFALNSTGRVRVVRNNVGVDRVTFVRYGLNIGSADLVGMLRGSGRVFACEVKTPEGSLTREQKAWLNVVNKWGGFACVARSVPDALEQLKRAESGENYPIFKLN